MSLTKTTYWIENGLRTYILLYDLYLSASFLVFTATIYRGLYPLGLKNRTFYAITIMCESRVGIPMQRTIQRTAVRRRARRTVDGLLSSRVLARARASER